MDLRDHQARSLHDTEESKAKSPRHDTMCTTRGNRNRPVLISVSGGSCAEGWGNGLIFSRILYFSQPSCEGVCLWRGGGCRWCARRARNYSLRHGCVIISPVTPTDSPQNMLSLAAASAAALETSCFCGAVRLRIVSAASPIATSICHCSNCRRLSGAPFLSNVILPADALAVTSADGAASPDLLEQATSKQVTRKRCAKCYAPVFASLGKARVVVPSSLFASPHPESWKPQHHLYYASRTLDMKDDLPKYRANFGGELWTGDDSKDGDGGAAGK